MDIIQSPGVGAESTAWNTHTQGLTSLTFPHFCIFTKVCKFCFSLSLYTVLKDKQANTCLWFKNLLEYHWLFEYFLHLCLFKAQIAPFRSHRTIYVTLLYHPSFFCCFLLILHSTLPTV